MPSQPHNAQETSWSGEKREGWWRLVLFVAPSNGFETRGMGKVRGSDKGKKSRRGEEKTAHRTVSA